MFQNPGKIFLEKDTVGRCQHPVIFEFVEKIFFIGSISVESLDDRPFYRIFNNIGKFQPASVRRNFDFGPFDY
ncbi:MAG: hypothetical protein IAC87_00630 [Muribaculum sp.]|uniref:Uncharacterized protein n=1 Tax=Candidatus Merdivivens faecigallinarum TaxID=2840871 RepID=A0A9D9NPW7_9BACT|nr:hypothetical protein [Candidatus Merdivivens faecigallinarum]